MLRSYFGHGLKLGSGVQEHMEVSVHHQAITIGVNARSGYVKVTQNNLDPKEKVFS